MAIKTRSPSPRDAVKPERLCQCGIGRTWCQDLHIHLAKHGDYPILIIREVKPYRDRNREWYIAKEDMGAILSVSREEFHPGPLKWAEAKTYLRMYKRVIKR